MIKAVTYHWPPGGTNPQKYNENLIGMPPVTKGEECPKGDRVTQECQARTGAEVKARARTASCL